MLSDMSPASFSSPSVRLPEAGSLPPTILDRILLAEGMKVNFGQDDVIYSEGDPCSRLFRVAEGAVRICKFRADGTRQIEAFYLPGDYFGFDVEREARFTAEAAAKSNLLAADAAAVMNLEGQVDGVANAIWQATVQDLRRSQEHILLLGSRNAQDRVLTFLEEMAIRLHRTFMIELPMSRQDIADYLGVTIETVSRSLTELVRHGAIALPRPRCVILKRSLRDRLARAGEQKPSCYSRLLPLMRTN